MALFAGENGDHAEAGALMLADLWMSVTTLRKAAEHHAQIRYPDGWRGL